MSNLFRSNTAQATQNTIASGIPIQSSVLGRCIPVVYGTTVVSPNLIIYGNFKSIPASSASQSGKGGMGGTGGKGGSSPSSTTYTASLAFALGMGPIVGVRNVYVNKGISTLAALGFSLFTGTYPQSAWGTAVDTAPIAFGYGGIAYIAAASYQLGTSATLPNHKLEVQGVFSNAGALGDDADPSLVVADVLANAHYGAGFPSARLGDLTNYQNYTFAAGLYISVVFETQRPVGDILQELMEATNSELVWSSGKLNIVPRGDAALTQFGKTYTPPGAPIYDLTDDDFLSNQSSISSSGSSGGDPVGMVRKRASDALNTIKFEYLDRSNQYAPGIAEVKRQELIDLVRVRSNGSRQTHMFAAAAAAQQAAQLYLQRQAIRNTYGFTLDQRYLLLDPMDIVTLTDSVLGLSKTPVRILEITENDDGSLNFIAEDYLAGVGASALYSFAQGLGPQPNWNASPGQVNAPLFFEPPDQLAGGLFVNMALSGGPSWGGCQIWVSIDRGNTYRNAGQTQHGPARMGPLTAPLASIAAATAPPTIDQTNTLSVDLRRSAGQLNGGTTAEALALATVCYVDGEYIAYKTATLTGANKYDLSYLIRGAYGSAIAAHATGTKFARLDQGIFSLPFTQDLIGQTIYVKFLSFNVFNGGLQGLGDVSPYTYAITGAALSSPLPNIANLRDVFVGSINQLLWDEITDFRPVRYQISKGASFAGAQILRTVAHPPFATQGDGTYWVTAISQPVPGLTVYSGTPQSVTIATSGSVLVDNVVATWDEKATGWFGTFTDSAVSDGASVRTGSNGNSLAVADFLGQADFLNGGLGQVSGTYTIPNAHIVKLTSPVACKVTITWSAIGQAVVANFLGTLDFLGQVDFLGYGFTSRVDVYPQIRTAQSAGSGFLARTDFLGVSDFLFVDAFSWGPWQKYETGYYMGLAFQAQMVLNTLDPKVIAEATAMTFSVDVPDRIDNYNVTTSAAGLIPITFQPDAGSSPAAFNGGPNANSMLPNVQLTIIGAQDNDEAVIDAASLSKALCNVAVRNAGSYVARNVHVRAQGF